MTVVRPLVRWSRPLVRGAGLLSTVLLAAVVVLAVAPPPLRVVTVAIVGGTSMEPTLRTGDLVVAVPWRDAEIGDVVVVESAGGYVIHRIVDRDGSGRWITRGDANDLDDVFPVEAAHVLGLPVVRVPAVGQMTSWAQTHPIRLAVAVTCVYLLSVLWHRDGGSEPASTGAGRRTSGPGREALCAGDRQAYRRHR